MHITDQGKKTLTRLGILVGIAAVFFGIRYAGSHGYGTKFIPAAMLPKVALNDSKDAPTSTASASAFAGIPSSKEADLPSAPEVRVQFWAWNAQMGCLYANGGPVTTKGSLMEKQGLKVSIKRQDDNTQLMAELTALAKSMHDGNNEPTEGVHFVGIMGDGSPSFLRPLNNQLIEAFGPDYRAEIVGSCGYSRGEDKLMGPEEWKTNHESLRGSFIAGVIRDGDWNVAVRFAADNGIPVNPDETTYDPDAMNFVNAKDYVDAGTKYIQGYCEDRKIVKGGKATGQKKHVCVQGVVTWTPVDVTIAKQKGGLVTVISTKQYTNQMPHVIIGIHKWNKTHREVVEKMLTAFLQGGDQVLNFPKALDRAAAISQEIYQEKDVDADFWKRYYLGVTEKDATGVMVELGGSKANNLADNITLFGLAPGSSPKNSRMNATYTVFGNIAAKMYPKIVPTPMPLDSVLDVSYLRAAMNSTDDVTKGEEVKYASTDKITDVVGSRGVAIEFATGSATLTPAGEAQLEDLFQTLQINSLNVVVNGHTDNQGNPASNLSLSERRADAVKTWLQRRGPNDFPVGRIATHGLGDTKPIADNSTSAGRSKNRRVEIIIGH
jgi:OOP family OmpA-OmpF porin